MKAVIRRYPERTNPDESRAVEAALRQSLPERLRLVELVFWSGMTIERAADLIHVDKQEAARWHKEFILLTASNFSCNGLS